MNSQDFRNLQEAYMEVVENQQLDEEITPERRAQYKRGLKVRQTNQETGFGKGRPRKRATSPQPGAQHYRKGMTQSHRDTMRDAAREENPEKPEGSGSLPKGKKLERQRKTGVSAESYDIYDIILSHLLDEGYADTQEQAEVIMVNMSEDWRESICEGMKPLPLPVEKMDAKAKELKSKFRKSKVGTPEASKLLSRLSHIVATRDSKVV